MAIIIHSNLDFYGQQIIRALLHPVASDPSTPQAGQVWYNTTDNVLKFYNGSSAQAVLSDDSTNTFTNKTFDANGTGNVLSNVEVADFASAAVTSDLSASALSTQFVTADQVKAYSDGLLAANDALVFKGAIDASANPNYPAADAGGMYKISVAGKVGGASGIAVQVGDSLYCTVDSTASGNHATVGSNWTIIQNNLEAASTDVSGFVELATVAESIAKTDATRAVTPAGLADFPRKYAADISNSSGATITAATHGLGATKNLMVQIFEEGGIGEPNPVFICEMGVALDGAVTWSTASAITGHIVIIG